MLKFLIGISTLQWHHDMGVNYWLFSLAHFPKSSENMYILILFDYFQATSLFGSLSQILLLSRIFIHLQFQFLIFIRIWTPHSLNIWSNSQLRKLLVCSLFDSFGILWWKSLCCIVHFMAVIWYSTSAMKAPIKCAGILREGVEKKDHGEEGGFAVSWLNQWHLDFS